MQLREYKLKQNPEYVDRVVDALLAESPELQGIDVDRRTVRYMLENSPSIKCLVSVENGELLAVAILAVGPLWYAPHRTAARDMLLWVPLEHRGGSSGIRLVKEVEAWVRGNGVTDLYLSQSTGIEVERTAEFYQRLGYTLSGFISHKRIDHVHRI